MGTIKGDRSVEIDAPIERCYEIAADVENAPEWQGSLKDVEVLERDGEGRAELVETKSLIGSWSFEDLGDGRTRATYALEADPGRMLGLLLRGPAEAKVRDFLVGNAADGLKQKAEG